MKTKHLLLPLFMLIAITNAGAQPVIKSQKTIGSNSSDNFSCMAVTKDGVLLGGTSNGPISADKSDNARPRADNNPSNDYWIVKLDKKGNKLWDKTIGGSESEQLTCIIATKDGGYMLGGYSESSVSYEKTQNSRGGYDFWIVKLDGSGNIQWDKTLGGSEYDDLYTLQQTTDGGYIIGGTSLSNISGEKTEDGRGFWDIWIVKLDASGNIQWDKTIGGAIFDGVSSIQQTTDGGYIIGGSSNSYISGEKTQDSKNSSMDFWIIKLNSAGQIEWDKTIGGDLDDNVGTITQTSDGGYIIGGETQSGVSGDKTEPGRGFIDFWIVKVNSLGVVEWDKTIGGNRTDYFRAVKPAKDGGYIAAGSSNSDISGEKTEAPWGLNLDYWIVKLNSSGQVLWDKTIGGSRTDDLSSIEEIGNDVYLLGGDSYSNRSGDKTQNNRGTVRSNDYWVVIFQYSQQAAFNTNKNFSDLTKNNNIVVYPNPAKHILHIQNTGIITFTLTNQSGKILITKTINGNGEINVSHLPAGLYYLKNNKTSVVQKVMIAK